MDRFVWFVLLVVMSHLVAEFTRVTGYARGNRNDVILLNDSLIQPMPVPNMVFSPGQNFGLYDRPSSYNNNNNMQGVNAQLAVPTNNERTTTFFSIRPLIDSIFDIPISTLRAVNNLVSRLTGGFQHTTAVVEKSVEGAPPATVTFPARGFLATNGGDSVVGVVPPRAKTRHTLLREESA